MRASRMEYALLECNYPNRSILPTLRQESQTRGKGSYLKEVVSSRSCRKNVPQRWYALTAINWVTPSATVKKRPSAVFAKRTATTLSIVIYLSGGALKKIDTGDDAAASAPLPEFRPSQPPLQPSSDESSSDESSSDGPPPSILNIDRNLYLMFLLHNLL